MGVNSLLITVYFYNLDNVKTDVQVINAQNEDREIVSLAREYSITTGAAAV